MAFGVHSIDRQALKIVALDKAARVFKVPITISTVEADGLSGNTHPELWAICPQINTSSAP